MRLVFVLYAEDRDLLPSRSDGRAREIYETSYSVRGLYAKLTEDATLNPDTMDERRGGWGGLLALFRLIHKGHRTGFVQARGGKLFDPDEFPFLEGRASKDEPARILAVSDGCLLRILEGLMTLKLRGAERERLSYRTLDVEQIGSVYETVMGFTVEAAKSRVLAIKAGKNNRTPVFVALDELLAKKGKDRIKELKENAGRALTAAQAKAGRGRARASTISRRRSTAWSTSAARPRSRVAASGTPILQPTGERRRTGSHYTPRVTDGADRQICAGAGIRAAGPGRDAGSGAGSQGVRPGHGLGRLPGRGLPRFGRAAGRGLGALAGDAAQRSRRTRTRSFMPAGWSRSAASMASTRTRARSISRGCRCGWRRWRATMSSLSSIMR